MGRYGRPYVRVHVDGRKMTVYSIELNCTSLLYITPGIGSMHVPSLNIGVKDCPIKLLKSGLKIQATYAHTENLNG